MVGPFYVFWKPGYKAKAGKYLNSGAADNPAAVGALTGFCYLNCGEYCVDLIAC